MIKDQKMDMALASAEAEVLQLINERDKWNTLYVDYHKPFVQRVWREYGSFRLSLHFIEPCNLSEALYHRHPWPSAMRVVHGNYEMSVGRGYDDPDPMAVFYMSPGSRYSSVDPHMWHAVAPTDAGAATIMLTGKPWESGGSHSPTKKLNPLPYKRKDQLLEFFHDFYLKGKVIKQLEYFKPL